MKSWSSGKSSSEREDKAWSGRGLRGIRSRIVWRAKADGRTKLGGDIMIHGKNVTIGCVQIGDDAIEDVFVIDRWRGGVTDDEGDENMANRVHSMDVGAGGFAENRFSLCRQILTFI